ncbi:MAG TPA: septation protein A [Erythrobacter sp.]|jgi:intracellular septation protein|uniref:Inner membrane-spanning protein YciB n=1 Tax=Qipengyuania citrea LAMA 915 TaxID=1306953 RepID=A0A0L1KF97_9SPHN|nr:inner membrane-spanning protein YciB [Qipengyuania citrea]MAG05215.1 septation protein A [Sphingomonadaceae bacterium]MCZ4265964.1 septation protein IspZ [Erythrobacter sp. G21629-S1]HAL89972.1 septation protein A [Erythrobacter sp.]KNH02576.1 septation protein a [Qipengyuania citrea LAMA 915]MAL53974.1 septation protein A [Sphingomonadaceae bacterium]|tara:strand:- start:675 stop:1322 length:648 start_codon:yes stop_codon:yes gene_type:complete
MTESAKPKPKTGWLNILVDYGPLLVFLGVYKFYQPPETSTFGEIAAVIYGTIAFMIAAVAALVFSKFKFGHVSPMLILSTALIVGFGGLTIWLQDEKFIQIKPTAIYLLFGVLLLGGWLRGKALLQILLEAAFEGVDRDGWLKLSRNWGVFFVFMAGLNEVLRLQLDFESWLWAKLWVFMPLSFLFTFSQIPMLLKHGLAIEDRDEVVKDEPPTA